MESRIKVSSVIVVIGYILIMAGGIFIYHDVEGWGYLDSAYFMVITATTIGYGDFAPATDLGKLITMGYSFIGIAFVFYLISLISHRVFERRLKEKVEDLREQKKDLKKEKKEIKSEKLAIKRLVRK